MGESPASGTQRLLAPHAAIMIIAFPEYGITLAGAPWHFFLIFRHMRTATMFTRV
jgi:hypothetical protein